MQVAKNLDIDPVFIGTFDWSGRNAKKYRQDIRQYLGYRVANVEDVALTINYLVDNLIPRHFSDSVRRVLWCRHNTFLRHGLWGARVSRC